ncbi:MAG: DUF2167 domain-containing protein [Rubrivivax sp.]|nr:DUF2167 domain-containing protein [Rubrivivax sp.]
MEIRSPAVGRHSSLVARHLGPALVALLAAAALSTAATAQQGMSAEQRRAEFAKLPWQAGPAQGAIGSKASLKVPKDARLLPESHGARFLELTGNLPAPGHSILVVGNWWAVFTFSDVGYVKDDEKLDAEQLLRSLREGDAAANDERRKRGIPQLTTEGWAVPPHFDAQTKQLEWGLKLRAEGDPNPVINYTVRMLGRSGYESVTLVSDAATLQRDVAELKALLEGFSFNGGQTYAEFKPGDHVAEIGLGALVLGGAAAAAVKSGWWKSLLAALAAGWKLIAGVAVAAVLGLGKLFGRKKA